MKLICRQALRSIRSSVQPKYIFSIILVAVVLILSAGPASAYTGFESSDPADGSVLEGPVRVISISYTGESELTGEGFAVLDSSGRTFAPDSVTTKDDLNWVLKFKEPLREGVVGVRWSVRAPDKHPIAGSFSFTIPKTSVAPDGKVLENELTAVTPIEKVDLKEFLNTGIKKAPYSFEVGVAGRTFSFIGTMPVGARAPDGTPINVQLAEQIGQPMRSVSMSGSAGGTQLSGQTPLVNKNGGVVYKEAGPSVFRSLKNSVNTLNYLQSSRFAKKWIKVERALASALLENLNIGREGFDKLAYTVVQLSHEMTHSYVSAIRRSDRVPFTQSSFDAEEHLAALASMGGISQVPLNGISLLYFFRVVGYSSPAEREANTFDRFSSLLNDLVRADIDGMKFRAQYDPNRETVESFLLDITEKLEQGRFTEVEEEIVIRATLAGEFRMEEWLREFSPKHNGAIKPAERHEWLSPASPFFPNQTLPNGMTTSHLVQR